MEPPADEEDEEPPVADMAPPDAEDSAAPAADEAEDSAPDAAEEADAMAPDAAVDASEAREEAPEAAEEAPEAADPEALPMAPPRPKMVVEPVVVVRVDPSVVTTAVKAEVVMALDEPSPL